MPADKIFAFLEIEQKLLIFGLETVLILQWGTELNRELKKYMFSLEPLPSEIILLCKIVPKAHFTG